VEGEQKAKPGLMSIEYVLGAGASRDVGYPLASDMGTKLLDFMQSLLATACFQWINGLATCY
jgi:hypothetical protein